MQESFAALAAKDLGRLATPWDERTRDVVIPLQRIELRGVDVMTFENDILGHNDVCHDGLSSARQIGLLPSADSLPDRGMTAAFNTMTRAKRFPAAAQPLTS
jgi:hypothetical protein